MRLSRHRRRPFAWRVVPTLALLALPPLATLALLAGGARLAWAVAGADTDDVAVSGAESDSEDGGTDDPPLPEPPRGNGGGPSAAPATAPAVILEGGANGALAAVGEAWTTWRYGRSREHVAVDETTNRLRVSGSGRSYDGLLIGFSVGILGPAFHPASYTSTAKTPAVAAVWARQDRIDMTPDIEWDTSIADAGPSSISVTITSMAEVSHTSERRGSITTDVTRFQVHGTVEATLPCARSTTALRQSCHAEMLHGSF